MFRRQANIAAARLAILILTVVGAATASHSQGMFGGKYNPGLAKSVESSTTFDFVRSFDANKDGKIDRGEFTRAYEAMFEIMDVSGDGAIDSREFMRDPAQAFANSARRAETTVRLYDADEDERLSPYEAPFWSSVFQRADANKDGFVDVKELTQIQFENDLLSEGLRVGNPKKRADAFLGKCDKNGDRKVSRDEFDWDDRAFDRYDLNKDNSLDEAEIVLIPPLPPSPRARAEKTIDTLDRDKNGSLSAVEFAQPPEVFHANDTNADGEISIDELTAATVAPPKTRGAVRPKALKAAPARVGGLRKALKVAPPVKAEVAPAP